MTDRPARVRAGTGIIVCGLARGPQSGGRAQTQYEITPIRRQCARQVGGEFAMQGIGAFGLRVDRRDAHQHALRVLAPQRTMQAFAPGQHGGIASPTADHCPVGDGLGTAGHLGDQPCHRQRAAIELQAGRTLAVVGESGCGKSTLAKLLTMIETPTAGQLLIDGLDVAQANAEQRRALRRQVQIVFQNPYGSLNPRPFVDGPYLAWSDLITPPMSYHRPWTLDGILRLSAATRAEQPDAPPAMRSPALLLTALAAKRELDDALLRLRFHEPTVGLDIDSRRDIVEHVHRLCREDGLAVLWTTHLIDEIWPGDQVVLLEKGAHVAQVGAPSEIIENPASDFVASFIGQANLWHGRQTGRAGRSGGQDLVEVEVLGTKLPAAPGATTIEPGGQATLMIRPERVRVTVDSPGAPTSDLAVISATVTDLTFQGPVVRLGLAAADDSPIVAHIGPDDDLPMLRPGDQVHVSWAPSASLVLPAADIPTTEDLEEMLDDS